MAGAGGGDSAYINDARRIQGNIQQLLFISSEISSVKGAGGEWLHGRLKEATSLATETHGMLKRFGINASESSTISTERSQRKQAHKKLNNRYQSALKTLDQSAQLALVSASNNSDVVDDHQPNKVDVWDSDEASLASSRLEPSEDGSRRNKKKNRNIALLSDSPNHAETPSHPLKAHDFYKSNQPQQLGHQIPIQQILTYPTSKQTPPTQPNHSVVELRDTATSTASGSVRSLASQRQLEYLPARMIRPDDLQLRLLAEEREGVLQIKKNVKDIRQLYQEMAWQVSNDADELDAIESQMRTAMDFSSRGVNDLRSVDRMVSPQKRIIWSIIGTLGISCVIVIYWIKFL